MDQTVRNKQNKNKNQTKKKTKKHWDTPLNPVEKLPQGTMTLKSQQ